MQRLEKIKAELSGRMSARQMELESVVDQRKSHGGGAERAQVESRRGAAAARPDQDGGVAAQSAARIPSKKSFPTAPTPPKP